MSIHQHLEQLSNLCQNLQVLEKRFDNNEISNVLRLKEALQQDIQRFEQEQQTLNIAIMGQVKAGKSSFLNALLFDGKPVLPTAATPKTANLTRISYGEKPALEIEYYSKEEWSEIEKLAQEKDESEAVKVAKQGEHQLPGAIFSEKLEEAIDTVVPVLSETITANKNSTLLDFFAGSGTTLVAAKKMGINYIGIEIEPAYIEIAEKRLIDLA